MGHGKRRLRVVPEPHEHNGQAVHHLAFLRRWLTWLTVLVTVCIVACTVAVVILVWQIVTRPEPEPKRNYQQLIKEVLSGERKRDDRGSRQDGR